MARGKKSFILYCDIIHTFEYLTDEQKGKVFDPRDIGKGVNFERLYSEFIEKAGNVEEYLFKLFQDLGGVAEKG